MSDELPGVDTITLLRDQLQEHIRDCKRFQQRAFWSLVAVLAYLLTQGIPWERLGGR